MTEHVETACPRCGEAAADYRFCPFCGLNLGSMSEVPGHEWETGYGSQQPAYEPLKPPTPLAEAAGSNGASEHTADAASATAVPEIGFDRFEDTAVEATRETHDVLEKRAQAEWETGDPSQQPAYEPLEPAASACVSGPDSNGCSEHIADEASATAVPEIGFDRFEGTAVEATRETHEAVEEPAGAEWETGDPSQKPAYEPLEPAASAWVSGLDSNGGSEHTVDDACPAAASEVDFDRGEAGGAAAEATGETPEVCEVRPRVDREIGDPSQQSAYEPLQVPASAWLGGPDSNGASEYVVDETSAAAASEVGADRSTEEDISTETVGAEPSRSDRRFAESSDGSAFENPAPLRDHPDCGGRVDGSLSADAHRATRCAGSQSVTFACLAAVIGLLVLVASRSRRGRG